MDDAFIFLATAIGGFAFAGVLLLRWRTQQGLNELCSLVQRAIAELHDEIDELRDEIKSIRAAATPVTGPPRAGADLTSPAPAVSPGDRYPWRMENEEDDGA